MVTIKNGNSESDYFNFGLAGGGIGKHFLSAISDGLSSIFLSLSAISFRLSAIFFCLSSVSEALSSVFHHLSSIP
ncbi:hypothetical protein [Planococcus halotolerans]|uniref:Uncharacterized protein n=1 Tax=Planococcus halotolerans TaxID=2233542 RepID=A0A365L732_9BACL|nr:hypothetical protein [Planococcus halotolerans]RAZ81220.1 hypothetical protein DP120_02740 [Planococcus halotolerans]